MNPDFISMPTRLTYGNWGIKDDQAHFRPLPQRIQIYTPVDQSLWEHKMLHVYLHANVLNGKYRSLCRCFTWAKSLLLVLRVLVLMVTGLWTSLASRKSTSWIANVDTRATRETVSTFPHSFHIPKVKPKIIHEITYYLTMSCQYI